MRRLTSKTHDWSASGRAMPAARELREADLFFAELTGAAIPPGLTATRRSPLALDGAERDEEEDAASCPLPKGSSCAYFFKGTSYVRYNVAADRVDVGPVAIASLWHLPPEFQSNLDAAVNWGDGHAYFFKGAGYVRYNIATDRVDVGPAPIAQFWRLPTELQSNLDAAVNWGNGHAYFFKGASYVRYDIASDRVDVGPAPIAKFWSLPAEFQSNLDAAVNWGNGHAYFFKGTRYVRYDIASDRVDVGPAAIAEFWPALPAEFHGRIKATINWTYPCDLAALMRAAGLSVHEVGGWSTRASSGRGGCFTPVGIVIHHVGAVGANALADVVRLVKANFYVDRAGLVNVVSGGRANHAGPGAQLVLDEVTQGIAPSDTAARRGLHDGPVGNGHFYGFENENLGDGIQPWPAVQLDAIARGAAALCQRHAWPASRVISHAEWTRRKGDPVGIDMNDLRARVAALL